MSILLLFGSGLGSLLATVASNPFLLAIFLVLYLIGSTNKKLDRGVALAASWLISFGIWVAIANRAMVWLNTINDDLFPPVQMHPIPPESVALFVVGPVLVFLIFGIAMASLRGWQRLLASVCLTLGGFVWAGAAVG